MNMQFFIIFRYININEKITIACHSHIERKILINFAYIFVEHIITYFTQTVPQIVIK